MMTNKATQKKRIGSLRDSPKWASIRDKFEKISSASQSDDEGSSRSLDCSPRRLLNSVATASLTNLSSLSAKRAAIQKKADNHRIKLNAIQALSFNRRRVYSEHTLRLDREARILSKLSSKKLNEIATARSLCSATRDAIEASKYSLNCFAITASAEERSVFKKSLRLEARKHIQSKVNSSATNQTPNTDSDEVKECDLIKPSLEAALIKMQLGNDNAIHSFADLPKLTVKEKVRWLENAAKSAVATTPVKKSCSASEITRSPQKVVPRISLPLDRAELLLNRIPTRSNSLPVPRQRQFSTSISLDLLKEKNLKESADYENYSNREICQQMKSRLLTKCRLDLKCKQPIPNPRGSTLDRKVSCSIRSSSAEPSQGSEGFFSNSFDTDEAEYAECESIYETLPGNISQSSSPRLALKRGSFGRNSLESASLSEDSHWPDSSDSGSYSSNLYDTSVLPLKAVSPCPPPLPPRFLKTQGKQSPLLKIEEKPDSRETLLREAAPAILDAYETIMQKIGDNADTEHIYQGIYDVIHMPKSQKTHSIDETTLNNLIQVIQDIQATVSSANLATDKNDRTVSTKSESKNRRSIFGRKKKSSSNPVSPELKEMHRSTFYISSSAVTSPAQEESSDESRPEEIYENVATVSKESSHQTHSLLQSIISSSDNKLKEFLETVEDRNRPTSLDLNISTNRISTASSMSSAYVVPSDIRTRGNLNDLEINMSHQPWTPVRAVQVKRTPSDKSGYVEFRTADVSPFDDEPLYQFYDRNVKMRAWLNSSTDNDIDEDDDNSIYAELHGNEVEKASPMSPLHGGMKNNYMHTSAMELVTGGNRRLWCEIPIVKQSGLLEKLSSQQRKVQEAIFEVISSEASYLKSLQVLVDHFKAHADFENCSILNGVEKQDLFSNVDMVKEVSERLFKQLDERWQENILVGNICDILYDYASHHFEPYVHYCQFQVKQERTLKKLKTTRPQFADALKSMESNAKCQGLCIHSFLLLPMQRVTRYPLLVDAILKRMDPNDPDYETCKASFIALSNLGRKCNDAAQRYECWQEMVELNRKLRFDNVKSCPIVSSSRWLLKKGEATRLVMEYPSIRTYTLSKTPRWSKAQNHLFLFNDMLILTKKKSDDYYSVLDYCDRNLVQVTAVDDDSGTSELPPSCFKFKIRLEMLQSQNKKNSCCYFNFPSEPERERWIGAILPPQSTNPDEKLYDEYDCPQVICTRTYNALQPDELSLDEADSVNVFRKLNNWYEGERIRDGVRGWFPAECCEEIPNKHVRARNLRLRHRLMVLTGSYLQHHHPKS